MATKIVIANQKGGVGKTATALAITAFLADHYGMNVLAIDLDPSSNMTIGFNINVNDVALSLSEVLENKCRPQDAIVEVSPRIHAIPTRPDLATTFNSGAVSQHLKKNEIVKMVLSQCEKDYDWLIIDTAPLAWNSMTINGLALADYALIPCQMEDLSIYGITVMMDTIRQIRLQWINNSIELLGLLPTLYQKTRVCAKNLQLIASSPYKDQLLSTIIRRTASIPQALSSAKLITAMPKTQGYDDYLHLTEEIIGKTGVHA